MIRMGSRKAVHLRNSMPRLDFTQYPIEIITSTRIFYVLISLSQFKRARKTEKNDKGRFKKKKRFGKSLANKAPAMLLAIIDRKLKPYDKQLIKIDTWSVKASQYNHVEDEYRKKKLSERWNDIDGHKVQS